MQFGKNTHEFFKDYWNSESEGQVLFEGLWKTYKCMFFQIAGEIMLLLPINDIYEKSSKVPEKGNSMQITVIFF